MPLPDFTDGRLPAGRHPATIEEVRAALVDPFRSSTTRAAIFAFWEERREAVTDLVDLVGEWLDGSFSTDKLDPADIDLLTIIDGPSFDALPRHRRQIIASLVAGTQTEDFWYCDAGVVVRYPDDDLSSSRTTVAAGCWAGYFGHTREGLSTGIVEVMADGEDPIEVALEEEERADGEAQLRAHLDRFDRALQAFEDPASDERPGLRLMETALRRKRDELQGKLRSAQQVEVELTPLTAEPLPGPAMAALVAALCAGASDVARQLLAGSPEEAALTAALQLRLQAGTSTGSILLRAPDPDTRQSVPTAAPHDSLITASLHAILDAAEDDSPTDAATTAATALGDVVVASAAPVRVELRWPFDESREVELRP